MFQGRGKTESKLSLHALLLKNETMNVSSCSIVIGNKASLYTEDIAM